MQNIGLVLPFLGFSYAVLSPVESSIGDFISVMLVFGVGVASIASWYSLRLLEPE